MQMVQLTYDRSFRIAHFRVADEPTYQPKADC